MNKEEYIRWVIDNVPLENPDEASKKAQEKYEELTSGMTVTIVEHDWKDYSEHSKEVCKQVRKLGATTMHFFSEFHSFPHGSLDSIITVVSKEDITEEFAEMLTDLVINLGAEGS